MPDLQLDFNPRARRLPPAGVWLALAVAALAAAWVARQIDDARQAVATQEARHEALGARAQPRPGRATAASPELLRRTAIDNDVIDVLSVPWIGLFRGLESADARGLGLTSLVPNAHDHTLKLTGEAHSVPDVLDYVQRLSALRQLQQVRLLSYETVTRNNVDLVTFSVSATWQDP